MNSVIFNDDLVAAHEELEGNFRTGFGKFTDGANQMAVSLYDMQNYGTWRVAKDSHDDTFRSWTDYVEWLADDVGIGRSTAFAHKGAVAFAKANSFAVNEEGDLDLEKFLELGGVMTFGRIKKAAITDRNGKIISVKGVSSEDPDEVFKAVVDTIDPQARPMDQVRLIKEVINEKAGLNGKVEISLRLRPSSEGGFNLIWEKESNAGLDWGLVSDPVPKDVLEELKSEFHILT